MCVSFTLILYRMNAVKDMKRAMNRLPEQMLRDEAEMRAFYESVGISERTIDAAIKVRRNKPIEQDGELKQRK
jgi:hypothetical protein